ncbi:hypothetical protein Rleg5DRAFT_3267 [Rhizobium leguminosarum bv. viciae WSM1455]|nr:hypothetical protein Rleg5DRAFT_3267 [Rhizobium leguminosarum bv. viciae WSM1455]
MRIIACYAIVALVFLGIGFVFTGKLHWFLAVGVLLTGTLERLVLWLLIGPEREKSHRLRLLRQPAKPSPDQNNPSI